MECAHIKREEVVERYLTGSLGPQERESFEEHYFACEQCFSTLQAHRALQAELSASAPHIRAMPARNPTAWRWTIAMATAAVVVLAVLGIRWGMRPGLSPPAPPTQTTQPGPAGPSLAELARFDPPSYTPAVLRGVQDEPMRKFRVAMKHYQQGDYARAITGLREAAKLNPKDAGAPFFLGVSYLLSGQTDEGIAVLQQSVALGETPYLEEAHHYLAKAFLRKGDLAAARRELEEVVRLKGDREDEARRLLQQLAALAKDSP
jgi:tetratricopeptide (TPR) repeat protein